MSGINKAENTVLLNDPSQLRGYFMGWIVIIFFFKEKIMVVVEKPFFGKGKKNAASSIFS